MNLVLLRWLGHSPVCGDLPGSPQKLLSETQRLAGLSLVLAVCEPVLPLLSCVVPAGGGEGAGPLRPLFCPAPEVRVLHAGGSSDSGSGSGRTPHVWLQDEVRLPGERRTGRGHREGERRLGGRRRDRGPWHIGRLWKHWWACPCQAVAPFLLPVTLKFRLL